MPDFAVQYDLPIFNVQFRQGDRKPPSIGFYDTFSHCPMVEKTPQAIYRRADLLPAFLRKISMKSCDVHVPDAFNIHAYPSHRGYHTYDKFTGMRDIEVHGAVHL